jgi:hypothetical protein
MAATTERERLDGACGGDDLQATLARRFAHARERRIPPPLLTPLSGGRGDEQDDGCDQRRVHAQPQRGAG